LKHVRAKRRAIDTGERRHDDERVTAACDRPQIGQIHAERQRSGFENLSPVEA
jgi:hypothetical protein